MVMIQAALGIAEAVQPELKEPVSGSSEEDQGYAITVNEKGEVFIAGSSRTQWGYPVNAFSGGGRDCFVAKLNDNGQMVWNTFLGGLHYDECRAITLDKQGNLYVAGESGSAWGNPVTNFTGGSHDGFVAKLDNKGNLLWNTFMGGLLYDGVSALVIDKAGNIYAAGNSVSSWGVPVNQHTGENQDGFVAMLDDAGLLHWNTFLGGGDYDSISAIAIDVYNNLYVAGESFSGWGSPVKGFVHGFYGDFDAFVAKLNSQGGVQWNTFLGGRGSDYGRGIAVDSMGDTYVVGNSNISWGLPLEPHHGNFDAFIVKLDDKGMVQWNTFLGGEGPDYGRSITTYWTDNIFLTGQSSGAWGKPLLPFSGDNDAFVVKINSQGIVQWNSFLGGSGTDSGNDIKLDTVGNVYIAGESSSSHENRGDAVQGGTKAFAAMLNNEGILRWMSLSGKR